MEKNRIKEILREGMMNPKLTEDQEKKENKNYNKDYTYVQEKLSDGLLKASQVMAAAGLGKEDDATDRSLFSKKLRKFKNPEGGTYMFSDDELAAIVKVINNPISF